MQTWKNVYRTFQSFNQAYAENCMSRTKCYEWFKHFEKGRMSVGENSRPGQHSTSTDDDRVLDLIRGNRHLTVLEIANYVGIIKGYSNSY